jgi:hypothetical protein
MISQAESDSQDRGLSAPQVEEIASPLTHVDPQKHLLTKQGLPLLRATLRSKTENLKQSLECPRPRRRLFVIRQLDFVSEIAASSKIGNPGDCHKIEDSIAQKQTKIRFRSKCTRKT